MLAFRIAFVVMVSFAAEVGGAVAMGTTFVVPASDSLAEGASASRSLVKPFVTAEAWEDFCDGLRLSSDQRSIVALRYRDYLDSARDLGDAMRRAATKVGVGPRGDEESEAEHRARMMQLRGIMRDLGPRALDLFRDLTADVEAVLTDAQREDLAPAAARTFRRSVLLHPFQHDSSQWVYAGEGVDLVQLLAEASRPEGPLAFLIDSGGEGAEVRQAMRPILEEYAAAVDRWLSASYEDVTYVFLADDRREGQSRRHEAWSEFWRLNDAAAERIEALLVRLGKKSAGEAWMKRYLETSSPFLVPEDELPERAWRWLERQDDLSPDARAALGRVYDSFHARRRPLRRKSLAALREAREHRAALSHAPHFVGDDLSPGTPEELVPLLKDRRDLSTRTLHRMRAIVTDPNLRSRLDELLKATKSRPANGWHVMF